MSESHLLFTTAAALLMLAFAALWPALARRVPRRGWICAGVGALIPMLDLLASYAGAEDRIAFLARTEVFAGPLAGAGVALAVALAWGILSSWREGAQAQAYLLCGLAVHWVLRALTPLGLAWAAPLADGRTGWPVFPSGQPVLAGLFLLVVAAQEAWPGSRVPRRAAAALAVLYAALGVGGWTLAAHQALPAAPGVRREITPANPWLTAWSVVDTLPGAYRTQRIVLGGAPPETAPEFARWNDETLALHLLGDPIVFRMYTHAFLHPVIRAESADSQTSGSVQELRNVVAEESGPRLVVRIDAGGRNRLYRLERFD
jgi:MFS family permease